MRLIFHGILRDKFGPEVVMHADSVADAIEGYSRQQPEWPRELLIDAVGFDSLDSLKERPTEVHLVPAFVGGGGKFGAIILGAAMIGLAFVTGGASIAAGTLITSGLGGSLIIGGAMMILQGVIGLFMKAPKLNKNNQDPEASKYLGINKNTTAVGTKITMAWGRIDLAGHWLSLQSDSNNLSFGVFPTNPT